MANIAQIGLNVLPFKPIKGQSFNFCIELRNAPNTGGVFPGTDWSVFISKDGGNLLPATNKPTLIGYGAGASVNDYLTPGIIQLTADEMNADVIYI